MREVSPRARPVGRRRPNTGAHVPGTLRAAERVAETFRRQLGNQEPITDLGRACEVFGLFTFAVPLGVTGP